MDIEKTVAVTIIDSQGNTDLGGLYIKFIKDEENPTMTDSTYMGLRTEKVEIISDELVSYQDQLFRILKKLPGGSTLKFENCVEVYDEETLESDIITIEELVSIRVYERTYSTPEFEIEYCMDEGDEEIHPSLKYLKASYKKSLIDEVISQEFYEQQLVRIKEASKVYKENEEKKTKFQEIQFELTCTYKGNNYQSVGHGDFRIALYDLIKNLDGPVLKTCPCCRFSDHMRYGDEDLRHGWFCFRDLNTDFSLVWYKREDDFERAIRSLSAFHCCDSFSI